MANPARTRDAPELLPAQCYRSAVPQVPCEASLINVHKEPLAKRRVLLVEVRFLEMKTVA